LLAFVDINFLVYDLKLKFKLFGTALALHVQLNGFFNLIEEEHIAIESLE